MKNNWNLSGLILEGICGTGKSTLLQNLLKSKSYYEKTFLSSFVLSEHHTQRVLEHMPWCTSNRTNMRLPFIFERFHLTHVYHYQHMSWGNVEDIDSRLAHLNCKICLLTMNVSQFRDRIINSRDEGWRDYLKKYGNTDDEILNYYIKQQDFLQDLCEKSKLNTLLLNTTELTVEDAIEQVLAYWGIV